MNEEMMRQVFELLKETLERQERLEGMFNDMISVIDNSKTEFDTSERRKGFRERNAGAFEPYQDKLKAIEGDNFDVVDQAFANYDALEDKPSEEEFVAAVCAKIDEQLKKIAKAYGVEEVIVEQNEDGTSIKVKPEETIAEVKTEEQIADEDKEDAQELAENAAVEEGAENAAIEEEEEEIDNPEEIEEFVKELEEAKKYQ